jgi:hypothetical protein
MGTLIPQTKYDVLAPGTYRVRLGAAAVEDGIYGAQVVMRLDVLDEGFAGRCIKAWAAAKLSGGRRPSKLYSWTSALLFAGKPLPDDYDLDTDALRGREAWAVVDVIDRDGVLYNRVAQLFPLRAIVTAHDAHPGLAEDASLQRGGSADFSPDPPIPAESEGIFDEEPPW